MMKFMLYIILIIFAIKTFDIKLWGTDGFGYVALFGVKIYFVDVKNHPDLYINMRRKGHPTLHLWFFNDNIGIEYRYDSWMILFNRIRRW